MENLNVFNTPVWGQAIHTETVRIREVKVPFSFEWWEIAYIVCSFIGIAVLVWLYVKELRAEDKKVIAQTQKGYEQLQEDVNKVPGANDWLRAYQSQKAG